MNAFTSRMALCAGIGFMSAVLLQAQPSGQWDFDSGNLIATVGSDLEYFGDTGALAEFGTTTSFGLPPINGTNAAVMKFPASTNATGGYEMPTPAPNGGGSGVFVHNYTIIFDILYPASANNRIRPLVQTDDGIITPDADLIVAANNGLGITPGGPFTGTLLPNTWYRIAFVVDTANGVIRKYINGAEVGTHNIAGLGLDHQYALTGNSFTRLLSSTDTNATEGYVNSIQLRAVALNAGQMAALGGPSADGILQVIPPVPSYIQTRAPDANAAGINPQPDIAIVLASGDTTIDVGTVQLSLDGAVVGASVTPSGADININYTVTTLLLPLSTHTLKLVYSDSAAGFKTNIWTFTVIDYQSVNLPSPIYLETFDSTAEGEVPAGWVLTNATAGAAGLDLNNPNSDSYKDFVVISSDRLATLSGWDGNRRIALPPIAVNGQILDRLVHGNLLYGESDQRSGSQVQVAFSPDYDLTGRNNVFVGWFSSYEQNQDNIASVEYSIDGGTTWLPIVYMVDDQNRAADLIRFPDGRTDAIATLGTARGDHAYGLAFSNFIGAVASTNLAPFISGRINDDNIESKRVELHRLPLADNRATVRLRFMQAGTASWYFGIDDVGFYSINTPVITTQPQSQTVDEGSPVIFNVVATGNPPLTYQWQRNGSDIPGATSSSYTNASVLASDVGLYNVIVRNADGPTTSGSAQLTVVTNAVFLAQPLNAVADLNSAVSFSVTARGGQPLLYQWYRNNSPIVGATSATNNIASAQVGDAGNYLVVISNAYGSVTSRVARLTVVSGPITQDLVAHLRFDGDSTDSSGRNNHGTAMGSPGFDTGKIGSGALQFTTASDGSSFNYVSLGTVPDLQFGATNDFSVSFWGKLTPGSWSGDPAFIANKDWDSGGNVGWVASTDGDGRIQWNYREEAPNNRRDYDGPGGLFSDGNWHHIVMVFIRGGRALTYVDGLQVNVQSLVFEPNAPTSIDGTLPINIGQDGAGNYSPAVTNGMADDVGIWRRALTPNQAAAIYNAGLLGNDLSQATVGGAVPPPTITAHPQDEAISAGANASFSVAAGGGVPLSYLWLFNGAPLAGATSQTLVISNAQPVNAGLYRAVVSNAGGSVTSSPANLTITSRPVITTQPASVTTNQNLDVTLTVVASGALTYQWQRNGADVPNATNATLALPSVQPSDAGTYRVITRNGSGDTTSDPAVLTVLPVGPISVTGQWDFNNGDLSATVGNPLEYFNATIQADTAFGSTTSFGIPDIAGQGAEVMRLTPSTPSWGGYIMRHGAAPNGGGAFVNQYTLIYDLYYPPASDATWRSLFQTSPSNTGDGDFFVNPSNGIGISGNYQGVVSGDAWHRIVLAVDLNGQAVAKFIDGVKVGVQILSSGTDGRFSLDTSALLFADEDGEHNVAYVNSLQFRNGKMSDADIAALGVPAAGGIPGSVPAFRVSFARQANNLVLSWVGGQEPFTVQKKADLNTPGWTDVTITSSRTATVPIGAGSEFFRVVGSP